MKSIIFNSRSNNTVYRQSTAIGKKTHPFLSSLNVKDINA
jgi:hypothetical protein